MSAFTDFMRSRRKDIHKDQWWSTFIWYFFFFFFVTVAGVNFAFFIVYWKELEFDFSKTSIYITFVGFLFAFAGINIYSIFNTNIEEEKKRLYDLNEKYKEEIQITMCLLDFSKKHIKYYQLSQMIASTTVFNSQLIDWLDEFDRLGTEFEEYLFELSQIDKEEFNSRCPDFIDINRSVYYLFESFQNKIKQNEAAFFTDLDEGLKKSFLNQLAETIKTVNDMQTRDFSEKKIDKNGIQADISVWEGLCITWKALWRKIRKRNSLES